MDSISGASNLETSKLNLTINNYIPANASLQKPLLFETPHSGGPPGFTFTYYIKNISFWTGVLFLICVFLMLATKIATSKYNTKNSILTEARSFVTVTMDYLLTHYWRIALILLAFFVLKIFYNYTAVLNTMNHNITQGFHQVLSMLHTQTDKLDAITQVVNTNNHLLKSQQGSLVNIQGKVTKTNQQLPEIRRALRALVKAEAKSHQMKDGQIQIQDFYRSQLHDKDQLIRAQTAQIKQLTKQQTV